MKTRNT